MTEKNAAEKNNFVVTRQTDVANFFSVATSTVKDWTGKGMPGRKGAYDLSAIVQWLRSDGPWQPHGRGDSDDVLLSGESGESPGLERYRTAKAEQAELDVAERRGLLLSREKARAVLGNWAAIIRRTGERLSKRFGSEAATMLNEGLTQCDSVVDEL